jgi:predicted TPR repeat methyltransferase
MSITMVFRCLLLGILSSRSSSLRTSSLLLGIADSALQELNGFRNRTVNSIRSIETIRKVYKEPTQDVKNAMKQCEAAILKPKNDEMPKGPSFCLGLLKQSIGDLEGALLDYERAVVRLPQNSAAYFNSGGILENLGRDEEAAVKYKESMRTSETCEASFCRLIPLLLRNNKEDEAELICHSICESGPQEVKYSALRHLGSTYYKLGSIDKAFDAFKSALEICQDPVYSSDVSNVRLIEALNNAGQAATSSVKIKNHKLAEDCFLRSLSVSPDNADTHTYYGVFLKYDNRISEAIREFQTAIELDPTEKFKETGYASVQLASITGGSATGKMTDIYVSGLFDGYADRFDDELVMKLGYAGHHHVVVALERALANVQTKGQNVASSSHEFSPAGQYSIIDIGSGTGLCGELLRKQFPTAYISGVDLSQRMLEKATEKSCYNRLTLGDAISYLNGTVEGSVDGIVAADVFIYVGDLKDIFNLSYHALKPEGSFLVFTIEELQREIVTSRVHSTDSDILKSCTVEPEVGVKLLPCGRFGHSGNYVKELAVSTGFRVVRARKDVLRTQSDIPVKSITYTLTKL